MRRETISIVEFERYEQGVKATIKRIQAENTWLRTTTANWSTASFN